PQHRDDAVLRPHERSRPDPLRDDRRGRGPSRAAPTRDSGNVPGLMSYAERLVGSALVACTWELVTAGTHEPRIVPDACVDLIWSGERLTIAGPDTSARPGSLAPRPRGGCAGAPARASLVGRRRRRAEPAAASAPRHRCRRLRAEDPGTRPALPPAAVAARGAAGRARARRGLRRPGPHDRRGHAAGGRFTCPISQRPHADRRVAWAHAHRP